MYLKAWIIWRLPGPCKTPLAVLSSSELGAGAEGEAGDIRPFFLGRSCLSDVTLSHKSQITVVNKSYNALEIPSPFIIHYEQVYCSSFVVVKSLDFSLCSCWAWQLCQLLL